MSDAIEIQTPAVNHSTKCLASFFFVRVEIGSGTSAKWYRISDQGAALWQTKKLFERQVSGIFPPVTEWQDHGSGIVQDNSGW